MFYLSIYLFIQFMYSFATPLKPVRPVERACHVLRSVTFVPFHE